MKIVALASRRYEPDWLLDEMYENLSWCDDIIIYDDSHRPKEDKRWLEHERHVELHRRAGLAKADYCVFTSPDSRYSDNAEEVITEACKRGQKNQRFFAINMGELFEKDQMRVDGPWSGNFSTLVYPWFPNPEFTNVPVHNSPVPIHSGVQEELLEGVWIYNLKPIERVNNKLRVQSYVEHDPNSDCNFLGESYDYLDDEEGMVLEKIPVPYSPAHRGGYISDY